MKYKINYPYFGRTNDGILFVIMQPKYMIALERQGTYGFGFAAYISRSKILSFYKFSKEVDKADFEGAIRQKAYNFFKKTPGAETIFKPIKEAKLIAGK